MTFEERQELQEAFGALSKAMTAFSRVVYETESEKDFWAEYEKKEKGDTNE